MARAPRLPLSVKAGVTLFVVVALALALVYAAVVPRLETRLVDAKIDELEGIVHPLADEVTRDPDLAYQQRRSDLAAQRYNVRVVVYHRLNDDQLIIFADSTNALSGDLARDPVAADAAQTGALESGRAERNGKSFAEVAVSADEEIVLVSASLQDALSNVQTVRRSLIAAGIASLAVSWLAGYLIAWAFTRRIKRLENAAERLAAGDFATRVVDTGRDEVAQLADAFDSMRHRLATLDRARSEFIANASHELRTPIFSLGGFLELLSDGELDEAVRQDFLAEMRGQVERMTRLATDLLDLSRLDAGQLEVESVPVDLGAAARVVGDEFRALAEAGGHHLSGGDTGSGTALADEQRVQQIARILVENALRHTPPGTRVDVAAGEDAAAAFFAVHDTGPGIPAEDQEHLFERFYRAGGGKASGSGLGLAIASELAQRMGGRIELRSGPGETVFTLFLPRAPATLSRENGVEEERVAAGSGDPVDA